MALLGKRSASDAREEEFMVEKTRRLNLAESQQLQHPAQQLHQPDIMSHRRQQGDAVAQSESIGGSAMSSIMPEPSTPNQEEEENRLVQELQKQAMEAMTMADYHQANSLLRTLHEERLRRLGGHS